MSYTSNEKIDSFVALNDLSLCINRLVAIQSGGYNVDIGAAGAPAYGVLINKPQAGEDASVVVGGITMVRVGAAVIGGKPATSAASGWAIQAVQGAEATKNVVGTFRTSAASGMLAALEVERFVLSNSVA